MTKEKNIWVFDIDGVITDPQKKLVTHPEIFEYIHQRLENNELIAFNTGRSAGWVENTILPFINKSLINQSVFFSCEMGSATITFDKNGNYTKVVTEENIIPNALHKTVEDIVELSYGEAMFVDHTKEVILTIEMKDSYPIDKYQEQQKKFESEINILLKNYHPGIHIQPSSSSIAIDVKPIGFNKEKGAELILKWLESININLSDSSIYCFGDSLSDIEMYKYFKDKKFNSKFIYVGLDKNIAKGNEDVLITHEKFTRGTIEGLNETLK